MGTSWNIVGKTNTQCMRIDLSANPVNMVTFWVCNLAMEFARDAHTYVYINFLAISRENWYQL